MSVYTMKSRISFVLSCLLSTISLQVCAGELEIPPKGKETIVRCAELPAFSYPVLVPAEYDPSKSYPIIYTFGPGGGGMIGAHRPATEIAQSILVGIPGSRNGRPEMEYLGEVYAIMWDTLARFNIDPAAQYAAGLSGGAVISYTLARQYKERIGGVMVSGGWLQNYDPWFCYPKGLLVARSNGEEDKAANSWCEKDMAILKKFGCVVKDWKHPGGHVMATPEYVKLMMQWLISNKSAEKSAVKAQEKAVKWNEALYAPATVKELLDTVKSSPRTRICNLALIALFKMMNDDEKFCKIVIPPSAVGAELTLFFGYTAYGAALANDTKRFRSAAFALDKVCQDKSSKWGGIVAAFYIFGNTEGVANPKRGLAFIHKYSEVNPPPYNQLLLAAASLRNGQKADAQNISDNFPKIYDKKLQPIIDNLHKALKEGDAALDSRIWIAGFGEGD